MWLQTLILTITLFINAQANLNDNLMEKSTLMSIDELPSLNIMQYLWMSCPPSLYPYECLTFHVNQPTRLEVTLYKTLCGKGPEIRFRVSSGIGFVYLGEDNNVYYLMVLCQLYPLELRRVQDYVLWSVPDAGIKHLTRNETVLQMEDLVNFANSIDATAGEDNIGHPVCYKKQ